MREGALCKRQRHLLLLGGQRLHLRLRFRRPVPANQEVAVVAVIMS